MDKKQLIEQLATLHNNLMSISVSGVDAFTLVQSVKGLRAIILSLQQEEEASKP